MNTSPQIDKIVPALIAVKSKLQAVTKDANNPFFKSKYADLGAHLDAVEPLLAENGLVLTQPTGIHPTTGKNTVSSILMHTSGQYISSVMALVSKDENDMQKLGSAVTYGRRYTLGALLGMKAEDDDGNAASGKSVGKGVTVGRGETATIVLTGMTGTGQGINSTDAPAPKRASFRKSVSPTVPNMVNGDDI